MVYKCLRCDKSLENRDCLFKECVCGHKNIIVNNVPIVVDDYHNYISNKIVNYNNYINTLEKQKRTWLSENDNQLIEIDNKITMLNQFKRDLLPYSTIENILNSDLNSNLGYNLSYEYLIRDWSQTKSTEEEIKIIFNSILGEISGCNDSVLVLGAGLARLAIEFKKVYKKVYAIDLSYEMPALLEAISKNSIEFNYYLPKNYSDYDNTPLYVKIDKEFVRYAINNHSDSMFEYFVCDVTKLPFASSSFQTIVSCYFTDVLPLKSYFYELDRVLQIGGSFIHFGPLDYHFDDVNSVLSVKELKGYFEKRGYEVELYPAIELEHIQIEIKGRKNVYTNWFFKATKKYEMNRLSYQSILSFDNKIEIYLKGSLINYDDELDIQEVTLSSVGCKSYDCSIDTVHILQKINGVKTISEIFEELKEENHIIDNEVKLNTLNLLSDLTKYGYLINLTYNL